MGHLSMSCNQFAGDVGKVGIPPNVTGGLFLVSVLVTIASGLIGRISVRSLYAVSAVIIRLGFGSLTTWVMVEIVKGLVGFVDYLQRTAGQAFGAVVAQRPASRVCQQSRGF